MKRNNLIYGALAIAVVVLLSTQGFLGAESSLCPPSRPYFGSINCEQSSRLQKSMELNQELNMHTGDRTDVSDFNEASYAGLNTYSFPKPSCGITNLFWTLKLQARSFDNPSGWQDVPNYVCGKFTSESQCQSMMNTPGTPLDKTKVYRMIATCEYLTSSQVTSVPGLQWKIQYLNENWFYHFDSAKNKITSTDGCKDWQAMDSTYSDGVANMPKVKAQTPSSTVLSMLVKNSALLARFFGGSENTLPGTLSTAPPKDGTIGDSYLVVYKWVDANPKDVKTYNGNQVMCNFDGNSAKLYAMGNVQTDQCRSVPTAEVASVECCSPSTCWVKKGGDVNDWLCDSNFRCVAATTSTTVVQCDSPFDCGSGQNTCVLRNGQYTKVSAPTCVAGKCVTGSTKTVKCCPDSCGAAQHCITDVGCTGDKTPCPTGQWCTESANCPYYAKSCASGLQKCGSGCVGECKTTCSTITGCKSDSECNDYNDKTVDRCVKSITQFYTNGECEHKPVEEVGCFEKCGVLNIGCTIDCYIKALTLGINAAIASGVKFIVSLVALAGGTLISNHLLKSMFKKRNRWKASLLALIIGFVCFAMVILT